MKFHQMGYERWQADPPHAEYWIVLMINHEDRNKDQYRVFCLYDLIGIASTLQFAEDVAWKHNLERR